jgi:two-component sensor histidine kinase/PAS domain-containing protein
MEELQDQAFSHEKAIAEALWVYDRNVLSAQVQGLTASPYISYASIVDESGEKTSAGAIRKNGGFELTIPVLHKKRDELATIGSLTLQANLETLRSATWSWVYDDLPITILGLALIATFLYLYFEKVVTRRLEGDVARLESFEPNGAELPFSVLEVRAGNEIETLERSFNDLTARLRDSYREAERARVAAEASERRYQALFDHSPVALWLEDFSAVHEIVASLELDQAEGDAAFFFASHPEIVKSCISAVRLVAVNSAAMELFHLERGDLVKTFDDGIDAYWNTEIFIGLLTAIARGEKRAFREGAFKTVKGQTLQLETYWEAMTDERGVEYARTLIAFVDVTQRVKIQEELSENLSEKEVLIRELFHRTKNNMQSILSLISFQSWKIRDEGLREALRALETRVYSMSLVHRMLYEYNNLSRLSLSAFIREFSAYVSASEDIETRGIRFDQRLEEIEVPIDVAVPMGLVIAELVDNALTHAFPNKRSGIITIELGWVDKVHIALTVADNGVGARPGFQAEEDGEMGLQLVESLAESQLGGTVEYETLPNGGFRCRITARPDIYSIRI